MIGRRRSRERFVVVAWRAALGGPYAVPLVLGPFKTHREAGVVAKMLREQLGAVSAAVPLLAGSTPLTVFSDLLADS